MKGYLVAALLLATALGTEAPTPAVEYVRRAGALGASGVVLVADGDRVVVHAAMGARDADGRVPNDTSTLFYIASLSKPFIAAAVLLLADEGRLRTTDSLGAFFRDVPPDKRHITVRDLLHHTSRLSRYGFDADRRDWAVQTRDDAVRGILASRLKDSSATFDYQNTNYLLLGAIVEHRSGKSFGAYLQEKVLRPFGMRETYLAAHVPPAARSRVAWSRGDRAETSTILQRPESFVSMPGMVTSARDLHRFLRALATGRLLSDRSRREMFSIGAELGPRYGYGAGWFVRTDSSGNTRIAFHGGDFGGYHGEARISLATGRTFVALTNASQRGKSITEALLNDLSSVAFGDGVIALPEVAPQGTYDAMAGEYRLDKDNGILVRHDGRTVVAEAFGQQAIDWVVRGDTVGWRVRQRASDATLAFFDAFRLGRPLARINGFHVAVEVQGELVEEWARLHRRGGRLKSYQLLGSVADGSSDRAVTMLRLTFERDSLLMGVGWANDTLAYTAPGMANPVAPVVFARLVDGTWASYDWAREKTLHMARDGADLRLVTTSGEIRFKRRAPS